MRKKRLIIIAAVAFIFLLIIVLLKPTEDNSILTENISNNIPGNNDMQYGLSDFYFPRDHGAHNDLRTEWWYFSGNLEDSKGRRFGYELTIFRNAHGLTLKNQKDEHEQEYIGHFAVTDISNDKFYYKEKFASGDGTNAGASSLPLKVWVGDWMITGTYKNENCTMADFHLRARDEKYSIDLNLSSVKPLVLQGDNGISRKGEGSDNFSYYYSMTRLATTGLLEINGEKINVTGLSWMDREWSNVLLGRNDKVWDWFSLQLDNNTEIMFYKLRTKNGLNNKYNHGALILSDGRTEKLKSEDVNIENTGSWESDTHRVYPSGWRFSIPRKKIELTITPAIKNQELQLLISYWEGAVSIKGEIDGRKISGKGYVELTGY